MKDDSLEQLGYCLDTNKSLKKLDLTKIIGVSSNGLCLFLNLIKTSNLEEINLYEIVGVDAVMKEMSNFLTSNQAKVLKISQWESIII